MTDEATRSMATTDGPSRPKPVSFEEFKLYYESAERVTERRLSTNRWNYSVSTAIVFGIGAILSWSTTHSAFRFVAAVGAVFLSGMAFFFCGYWIKQIDDFKALNTAKFSVLEKMAPNVIFNGSAGDETARSFEPFRKEWEDLENARALRPIPGRLQRVLALQSTRQEYFLPKAFRALFASIFLLTMIFVAISHGSVLTHVSPFSGSVK